MNSKSGILAMMAFAAMADMSSKNNFRHNNNDVIDRCKIEPKKIIPKGCKEYFFTKSGAMFITYKPNGYEVVFECFASNDKNALKKFDKFLTLKTK